MQVLQVLIWKRGFNIQLLPQKIILPSECSFFSRGYPVYLEFGTSQETLGLHYTRLIEKYGRDKLNGYDQRQ